ncbi:hypothetical protein ABD91_10865 [Lysinibacillus sphaericus]|uniref:YozE family protein n=1 Tax=Lysinibacillus sphaericus TaxID=1421 RepID=UPI0018CE26B6|nr:YozE family protein [Lysinibacillus sphaericus]MBG9691373.1 hypothetical protein [Lysinibacillus sphaericus]
MKPTFKQWILKFTNSTMYDGDFAHDIEGDPLFPNTTNYKEIYDYLESQGASDRVLDIFNEAWEEYSK